MKLIIALLAVFSLVSLGFAQSLSSLPKCSQQCATNAIPKECGVDVACVCKDSSFFDSISCCIVDTCTHEEQKQVLEVARQICQSGGVTDLPRKIVCTTASAANSTSSSGTTSTTTGKTVTSTTTGTSTVTATGASTHNSTATHETTSMSTATGHANSTVSAHTAHNSTSTGHSTKNEAVATGFMDGSKAAAGAAAAFAFFV